MKVFRLSLQLPVHVNHAVRFVGIAVLAAFLNACGHSIALPPVSPISSATAPIPLGATVSIPVTTATHIHLVRSGLAGWANTWEIHVGKAISEYSKAYLANTITSGTDAVIQIDLVSFDVREFEARCELNFAIQRDGREVFQKSYYGKGLGYAARVVWTGAAGMESSMQKTTDEAMRSIFSRFLEDLAARSKERLL